MYYQNEPRFNGVYSRDNLLDKIKDGAYVINLNEYSDIGTHWIAYVNNKTVTYFDSFGVEHIPKEIYIASFDYFDKSLIVLSTISGSISIVSFASYWNTYRNSKCKS